MRVCRLAQAARHAGKGQGAWRAKQREMAALARELVAAAEAGRRLTCWSTLYRLVYPDLQVDESGFVPGWKPYPARADAAPKACENGREKAG